MTIIESYLLVLSVRFGLFDFSLFKKQREFLNNTIQNEIFRKWLKCPYCHGFWVGIGVFTLTQNFNLLECIFFAFNSSILSLMWSTIFIPLLDRYEKFIEME